MASVYIIFSKKLGKYYIGSCLDLDSRLIEHIIGKFSSSYTSKAEDWVLFYSINHLHEKTARKIEEHIKSMKSRVYIQNLTKYPEISQKLIEKYSTKD